MVLSLAFTGAFWLLLYLGAALFRVIGLKFLGDLIGEPAFLGQGIGKQLVALLTDTVRSTTGAKQIIVQPDEANLASCGVLLANGYTYDEANGYYRKAW